MGNTAPTTTTTTITLSTATASPLSKNSNIDTTRYTLTHAAFACNKTITKNNNNKQQRPTLRRSARIANNKHRHAHTTRCCSTCHNEWDLESITEPKLLFWLPWNELTRQQRRLLKPYLVRKAKKGGFATAEQYIEVHKAHSNAMGFNNISFAFPIEYSKHHPSYLL